MGRTEKGRKRRGELCTHYRCISTEPTRRRVEWLPRPQPCCFPGRSCLNPDTSRLHVALPSRGQNNPTSQSEFLLWEVETQGNSKGPSSGGDSGYGIKPEDHRGQAVSRSYWVAQVMRQSGDKGPRRGRGRSQVAGSLKFLKGYELKQEA